MNNTFLLLVIVVLNSSSVQAQKKTTLPAKQVNVPENVNTSFKSLYTVTSNKWDRNYSGNYVASFINEEHLKQTVELSGSGAMIKSVIEYAPGVLPQNITSSILGQYPAVKITEAAKIQMPGVASYYKVKIITADNAAKELLISEEGTITE